MQLPTGVGKGIGEEGNVVEVDEMNVEVGVGVNARVSSTRSAGMTSGCTHSRMIKVYQYYCLLLLIASCQLVHILNKCTYLVQLLLVGYPSKSCEPELPHI